MKMSTRASNIRSRFMLATHCTNCHASARHFEKKGSCSLYDTRGADSPRQFFPPNVGHGFEDGFVSSCQAGGSCRSNEIFWICVSDVITRWLGECVLRNHIALVTSYGTTKQLYYIHIHNLVPIYEKSRYEFHATGICNPSKACNPTV